MRKNICVNFSTLFMNVFEHFIFYSSAYDFPFYGTQWHPEKNSFEWEVNACHTLDCVQLAQYMGNFFVQEGRLMFDKKYTSFHW